MTTSNEADALSLLDAIAVIEAELRHEHHGEDFVMTFVDPARVIHHLAVFAAALLQEEYDDPRGHLDRLRFEIRAWAQTNLG